MNEWNWQRRQEISGAPADTELNIGFVMDHLLRELNNFRLDIDLVTIERLYRDDKVRWGVSYGHDREVMGVGDTLVEAVIEALSHSGHEWD